VGWTFYNSSGQRLSSAATNISVLDIDGATDIGAAIVDADLFIIDDGAGGTNRKTAASRIKTYVEDAAGEVPIANLDIDGGTDIGAAIVDADLFIVDDGAGGTNRKTAASRLKTYVNPLTLVLSSTTTVGANGKSGVTLASATAGPTVYVWDAWIATDDTQVAIPLDFNANETISANVGTFLSRYSQTAGSTTSNFVIVNGSASSRAVVYQVFQIATP
jgi:hypothetical protein